MFKHILEKSVRFDDGDGGGSEGQAEGEPTGGGNNEPQTITTTQAELNKQFAARAKQAKEAERKALLEELGIDKLDDAKALVKAAKEAEEANKTELDRIKVRAETAEGSLATLQNENRDLRLQIAFEHKVNELELKFVNTVAAEDAFSALDAETVGDDFKGMENAIKKLLEDREYLFAKSDGTTKLTQPVNDGRQKGKGNQAILTAEQINNKRQMISPL